MPESDSGDISMHIGTAAALTGMMLMSTAGLAAEKTPQPRSAALTRLVDCRSIAQPEERLACFDREVAALDAAEASKQIVVVDKEQIRKTRRSLFGLELPDLGVFGGDDKSDDAEEVSRLEAKIKTASRGRYGQWSFELEDGARWVQTDDHVLAIEPKAGDTILIKRASFGSYMANVNGQRTFRIQRTR